MHSSRMRTGRSLTVCCSLLPGGGSPWSRGGSAWSRGGSPWSREGLPGLGGVLPGLGGSAWSGEGGSAWSGGVLLGPRGAWGGFSGDPPLWTESQTRVKT